MAKKYTKQYRSSVAVKERVPRRVLLWILVAALLLTAVAILVILLRQNHDSEPAPEAPASETPEPVSPPAESTETPLPDAMETVPAETGVELAVRNVQKRDGFPMLSWDTGLFSLNTAGRLQYSGSGVRTRTGIDVSEHQYDIDWAAVKADGIDFAMIRVGYRGSTAGGMYTDEYFERNMKGAAEAGVPVGVYFYSQATTPEEAREEAEYLLSAIRDYKITYPVVFDWEIVGGAEARTYNVSRRTLCECTRVFCDIVKDAGYDPMIYFTRYLAYRKYILRNLTDYGFWYAEYSAQPQFVFDFDMWQYSDTGTVAGIEGPVDLNILFVN